MTRFNPHSWASSLEQVRADYEAAKVNRFRKRLTGVHSSGSSADYHYRTESDYLRMMELARSFDRNDGLIGPGLDIFVQNVLQQAPRVEPQTGDEELNRLIKQELWEPWANDKNLCDAQGQNTLHRMAMLALRQRTVDGDHFAVPLRDGSIELVEGHRCRTPRNAKRDRANNEQLVHGVLKDRVGRRKEYWFTRDDVGINIAIDRVTDMRRIAARDADGNEQVWQVYNPKRVSQTRGVTALANVANYVGMHDDIQFAKLVQQQIVSCFGFIRRRDPDAEYTGEPLPLGSQETETRGDGTTRTVEGIAPGMEYTAAPGEILESFSPNVPNAEWFKQEMIVLTIIAVNLGLPVAVLLLDPSNTNFSGWRGAIDQARRGFTNHYDLMIEQFYKPIYEWKLRAWLQTNPLLQSKVDEVRDQLPAGFLFRHEWSRPHWPYIEPSKDATADKVTAENLMNSRRRLLARRGLPIEEVDREIVEDRASLVVRALEKADEINSAYPQARIDWRELVHFAIPKAVQVAQQRDGQSPPNRPEDSNA